ncbi:MAG: SRPBCC family protein [Ornithinibacter sp.]
MNDEMTEGEIRAAEVSRAVSADADAVWGVLSDGWAYTTWVVGASRVRLVDTTWPQEGAAIHHSFGVWPAVVDDATTSLRSRRGRELVLRARGWPMGEAQVVIRLEDEGPGRCIVSIAEDAVSGPGTLTPRALRQVAIRRRNVESLKRLAYLTERRSGEEEPSS